MGLATWKEYDSILAGIAGGDWRVIGWGAGVGFSHFNQQNALRHDYLVDKDPQKWNTLHDGYPVKDPNEIAQENPESTIIIIYNFKDHGTPILAALEKIGPYTAIMNFVPSQLRMFSKRLRAGLALGDTPKRRVKFDSAFVLQGPIIPGVTEYIVRYYCNVYPDIGIIVSTWEDTNEALVKCLLPYCDKLLLNSYPPSFGGGNRNLQIVSTHSGINEALNLGAKYAIKTRTDTLITADDILKRSSGLLSSFNTDVCNSHGLMNRILISERYTYRYIPHMVSDILMFGHVEDLLTFWSVPLDERQVNIDEMNKKFFYDISHNMEMTEVYINQHFLERIKWPVKKTLADHWKMLRDLFVVTDERWFGHYFPKYDLASMDDGRDQYHPNRYVDFSFWMHLYSGADISELVKSIDLTLISMTELYDLNSQENHIPVNLPELRRNT